MPAKQRRPRSVVDARTLARIASRVDEYRSERAAVLREIRAVIQSAEQMLADMGSSAASAPRGTSRRLSPEGRAKIVAALKKRWAKYHAGKGKAGA